MAGSWLDRMPQSKFLLLCNLTDRFYCCIAMDRRYAEVQKIVKAIKNNSCISGIL